MKSPSKTFDLDRLKQIQYKAVWEFQNSKVDKEQFECQACCDKEIIVKRDKDGFSAVSCDCKEEKKIKAQKAKEQKRYEENIQAAKIREGFIGKTFADFKELEGKKEAKLAAMDYVHNFEFYREKGIGITFIGRCGRGKSLLSHIIEQELLDKGYTVINVVAKEFYDDIKNTYNNPAQETSKLIDSAKKVDLLVIDNLNAKRFGADELEKLFIILNYRIENNKPFIVNSTGDMRYLERQLTEDHVSRLIGKNGDPIVVGGIDMRRKHGEAITKLRKENMEKIRDKG